MTQPQESGSAMELVQLIVQLAVLEAKVKPALPEASKKLVRDLLNSGCDARKLGQVIGRKAGWIKGVAAGKNSLSARSFTLLVNHAVRSQENKVGNPE